jgi:VCBS repeat-containing protein
MYSSGSWTYKLDNSRPATQGLQEGQLVTESFTATVRDNWGVTATQAVEVTVVGSYDTPLLG